MFKNIIFSLLLLVLGNTVNAAAVAASSALDYEALAAQQKLEIWHDVHPAAFYGGLPDAIARAIATYQDIIKTDRKALPSRIDALQAIARLATSPSSNITLLHQTAENKAMYLQGLLEQQLFLPET